jgi:TonB family protein
MVSASNNAHYALLATLSLIFGWSLLLAGGCTGGPPAAAAPSADPYPAQAKRRGLTGRVGLEYSLGEGGLPYNITVVESAGQVLDGGAVRLLSGQHLKVPPGWTPEQRLKMGVIFQLTNKPKVPPFEDNRQTLFVTGSSVPGAG